MPIRINLLAEAQAAEDLRRRDPAKRAIWVSAVLVAGILGWSGMLWMKSWAAGSTLNNRLSESQGLSKQFDIAKENQKQLSDAQAKLAALGSFASNRFLQANVMDTMMHLPPDVVNTIQVVRLRTEQDFDLVRATAASTSDSGHPIPGKPGASVEKITLYIDAKDSSANPGDEQITKYIHALASTPYFLAQQITTNNIQMRITGNVQVDADTGKPFIPFVLECAFPNELADMNKLSKDKRNQLVLIGLATVGAVAGLWFLLLSAQMDSIKATNAKIIETDKEIQKRKAAKKAAPAVQAELAVCQARLCELESTMPSGPPFQWVNGMLRKFNVPNYKVDMQVPGSPQFGDMTMIPDFPYHQLQVSVAGSAFYYDLGKFVADFENHFPGMRIQNLNLDPATAEEPEKLSFHMDIIILTKNDAP